MATILPHFAFPLRMAEGGHLAVVEQDSDEDILSCVYVALKTPIGSRPYVTDFGVDDYTFTPALSGMDELQAQIQASEPRVTADLSTEVQDLIETVIVGVENVG
jgi:phage baseplate assembly protein W